MRLKIKISLLTIIAGLVISPVALSHASSGVIYVSPSSSTVEVGHEFTVGIRINPGTTVDSVQTTLYYGGSLQYISMSVSAFPACTVENGGGGAVQLACAKLGGSVSSDSLIASVTFKAMAGSGSASLSLASPGTGSSNSNAASNGNWTNPSVASGSVNFYSPPPSNTGSHTSNTGNSGGSVSSTSAGTVINAETTNPSSPTPAQTHKVTKLTLTDDGVQPELSQATLKASTNISATVYTQYGATAQSLTTNSAKSVGTAHTLTLTDLTPGTTYYYKIIASSSDGQTVSTDTKSFTTRGLTVSVTVLDSHNQPLANQPVTLHSIPMKSITNSMGVVTFYNVAPGVHHLEYASNGQTYSQTVYVADDVNTSGSQQSAPTQSAAVIYKNLTANLASQNKPNATVWIILGVILALLLLWAILLRKVLRTKLRNYFARLKVKKSSSVPTFAGNLHQPKLK